MEIEKEFSALYQKSPTQQPLLNVASMLLFSRQQMSSNHGESLTIMIKDRIKRDLERLRELKLLYGSDVYVMPEYEEIMVGQEVLAHFILKIHTASRREDLDLP